MTYYTPQPAPQPAPSVIPLSDGRRLISPRPTHVRALKVGDWVQVEGQPWHITDLRFRPAGGGRIVHLHGRPPITVTEHENIAVYTVSPAPIPRG